MSAKKWSHDLYIYARAILYIEKKNFNIACQYLDITDEYLLFEYLLFNIHFSPCGKEKKCFFPSGRASQGGGVCGGSGQKDPPERKDEEG